MTKKSRDAAKKRQERARRRVHRKVEKEARERKKEVQKKIAAKTVEESKNPGTYVDHPVYGKLRY